MFAQPPGASVALSDFLLRLLTAWLCGQLVGWFYSSSHGVLSYSQNFVQSLVMLSMVICVIMSVVGDSLARAFGLAAALAIVRFRTPVKDARDTVFLFMSVAIGMAAGAGQMALAATSTIVIGSASVFLNWSAYGTRSKAEGLLRFRMDGAPELREAVQALLSQYTWTFELSAARQAGAGSARELVYDVNLRKNQAGDELVRALTELEGIDGVSLLPAARAGES
jgi:uncharacterized membrane protein YhiD involved in acid resistance